MRARAKPINVDVQARDIEVLLGLFVSRVMTLKHIAQIHFDGQLPMATKRLQKLKAAGYVGERQRRAQHPSILTLAKKGFELLNERGVLDHYPAFSWKRLEKRLDVSPLKLDHELEVMDLKSAVVAAVRTMPKLSIAEFSTWPALHAFEVVHPSDGERVPRKPDGFLRLHEREGDATYEYTFFVELDRSHEAQEILVDKCQCYREYFRSGGFAVKHGKPAEAFKEYPFRVLVVCPSQQRCDNLLKRLLALPRPIKTLVWTATARTATTVPFERIWSTPGKSNRALLASDT